MRRQRTEERIMEVERQRRKMDFGKRRTEEEDAAVAEGRIGAEGRTEEEDAAVAGGRIGAEGRIAVEEEVEKAERRPGMKRGKI